MTLPEQNYADRLLSKYTFEIDPGNYIEDATCIRCKKLLNDAYQAFCGCQYCRTCIIEYLLKGKRNCCGMQKGCNEQHLVLDENVFRNAMLNHRVLKTRVICPNESCTHSDAFLQMEEHLRMCTKKSIECPYSPLGCDTEKVTKDTILTHLANETLPHTQLLIDLIQNTRNEVEALKDKLEISSQANKTGIEKMKEECAEKEKRIAALEKESRDKDDRISTLEDESKKTKNTKIDTRERIDQLSTKMDGIDIRTNTIGVITFTVDKIDARRTGEEVIPTPNFYSHSNGYKLRLQIYPGGICDGKGTHLSVYIQICKGEYDDLLVWPCKYSFEVALINRSTRGIHHTMTLSYDTATDNCKNWYNKPINKDNIGHGYPKFVSVADLRSVVGLIVDDSVTIRCTVRPLP